jgi:hypothetical protein
MEVLRFDHFNEIVVLLGLGIQLTLSLDNFVLLLLEILGRVYNLYTFCQGLVNYLLAFGSKRKLGGRVPQISLAAILGSGLRKQLIL